MTTPAPAAEDGSERRRRKARARARLLALGINVDTMPHEQIRALWESVRAAYINNA